MTFNKNGTFAARGLSVNVVGTYKVTGKTVTLSVVTRNGSKPTNPNEQKSTLSIVDNGKALLADSGVRRAGKVLMMRLIRRPK